MSSLAQDELGHAAALYGLLAELTGTDADALAYDREPGGVPPLPAAGPRPRRLGDDDRPALPVRHAPTPSGSRRSADGSWAPLADLVGKLVREERYHLMHVGAWLDRLARSRGEPRDRLLAALAELGAGCGDGVHATPRRAGTGRGRDPGRADEPSSKAAGAPPSPRPSIALGLPMPPPALDPDRGRPDHGEPFRWLWGEFTSVRRVGPGSDLVSEAGIQIGDRPRAVRDRRAASALDEATVRAALAEVPGPGAADALGRRSRDRPSGRDRTRRRLDPRRDPADLRRLSGARAHQVLDRDTAGRIRAPGRGRRDVRGPLDDRADQRRRSRAHSWPRPRIAPTDRPTRAPLIALEPRVPCPHCGSRRTRRSRTSSDRRQCRTIRYCADCRQPFEAIKPI